MWVVVVIVVLVVVIVVVVIATGNTQKLHTEVERRKSVVRSDLYQVSAHDNKIITKKPIIFPTITVASKKIPMHPPPSSSYSCNAVVQHYTPDRVQVLMQEYVVSALVKLLLYGGIMTAVLWCLLF